MNADTQSRQYAKMTDTPAPRLIMTLAAPSIISMLVNNVYNLVDTAFVGRLGTSASGAVGVVFGFMAIIQAFGFMFGQGSGSLLSRALGRRDSETAGVYASAGYFGATVCGALITAVGFLQLDRIVVLLGSTGTIAPYAKTYISYILAAAPFMTSSLAMNSMLRYEGRAMLGMAGLMSGVALNILGDYVFMFVFGMGIAGAGLSTAISQVVSWAILTAFFLTGRTQSRLSLKKALHAGVKSYMDIIATGLPSLLRQGLNSLTTVILNKECAPYGDAAVAGMSITARVIFFVFSVALGVGQGFQPVAAFNYGAKKYSRIKQGYVFTSIASEAIVIAGCAVLFIFAGGIVRVFRDDPAVTEVGVRALRLQALAFPLMPFCMTTEMLYQSTGKSRGAAFLSVIRSGLLFIPLLIILARFRGLAGIQEAQPAAVALSLPVAVPFAMKFFRDLPKEGEAASPPAEK